jgi:acetyltransferase-like isoleucine patch superfamily enzyme
MNDGGYVRTPLVVGRYCSIGRRVTINAGGHRMSAVSSSPHLRGSRPAPYSNDERELLGIKENRKKTTVLGHDVWVGDGVVIMPGVEIGTGAVIGANAVLTKDVPPYAIAVGIPARVLRYRFPEKIRERLLDSTYWEIAHSQLNSRDCGNVFEFLDSVSELQVSDSVRTLYRME